MNHAVPDPAPLLVIAGPTAVGKSALALEVAAQLSAEIVSADSRQIYQFMDVGTAKPALTERALVPHHMVDIAYPGEAYSIARYRADAERAVAGVASRGCIPLVVGGSPHYLQALVDRLQPAGQSAPLRRWLERKERDGGASTLDAWLAA